MPKIGQLYTVAAQRNISNEIMNGDYKGLTLYKVFEEHKELFQCKESEVFPLLIGFVDANDHLSIQIHPTDAYAVEVEKMPYGKNESWVFIQPPESGEIFNGLKCKTIQELRENIAAGTVMDVVDTLKVEKDDYVYVESGTIHALTKGSLVYEIQQSTDLTYRFYDYKRIDDYGNKRQLHLEKALSVIQLNQKSKSIPYVENKSYEEKNYITRMIDISKLFHNDSQQFSCVTVINGTLKYDGLEIKKGMSFIALPQETIKFDGDAQCIIAVAK
jgi:mannose-6-phosphate isomerase class I